jgi:hypothetical protein
MHSIMGLRDRDIAYVPRGAAVDGALAMLVVLRHMRVDV